MGIIETIKMITREEALEEGIEKGIDRKNHEFVQNLLLSTNFSISKIAALTGVSENFVISIPIWYD